MRGLLLILLKSVDGRAKGKAKAGRATRAGNGGALRAQRVRKGGNPLDCSADTEGGDGADGASHPSQGGSEGEEGPVESPCPDDPIGDGWDTGERGPCWQGRVRCEDDEPICRRVVDPLDETCDGLDNDCNGEVAGGRDTGDAGAWAEGVLECADGAGRRIWPAAAA